MIWQRLKQFMAAVTAHISIAERVLLVETLSDGELLLFERMPVFDQRHCLDVYHTLVRNGYTDPLLLRAALIHDCGKVDDDGTSIPLPYYGIFVVLKALAPQLYARAAANGRGLLRPFAIHARHEGRSAALAEALGSPPEVVAILRDYAARNATARSTALHWADEQN
ncbi:MAG TPA: hypothetical protein VNL77_18090 [Roseiflexaceae bacterium]|nr:hypothetical protein [Roseiflexaceae bacterium]